MAAICSSCEKPYEKTNKSCASMCRPCYGRQYYQNNKATIYAQTRAWKLANPDKVSESGAREYRRRTYGVSDQELDLLYKQQEGKCAVCSKEAPMRGINGLHVDHDHKTNKVRGLLCNNCNGGLGQFKDNSDLLDKASAYLRSKR